MLGRLGIAGRLMLIAVLLLFAALAIGAGAGFVSRAGRTGTGPRLPLPDQIAAIVELLEREPPETRALLLRAANSDTFTVSVSDRLPRPENSGRRMPAVEWLVDQYFSTPGQHHIFAWDEFFNRSVWRDIANGAPLRSLRNTVLVAVALKGGGYAIFETRNELVRVFGLPPGFWAAFFGAVIAIIAVRAIIKEAKPLQALVTAVERFAVDAKPIHVAPGGARETRALIAAVNGMQERIAQLLASRTLLLGAISHDLKTYLTRLRLRIENIPLPEQYQKAERDLDDMARLIEDALAVARGATNTTTRETVHFDRLIRAEIEDRGTTRIAFSIGPGPESFAIVGNPVSLRRLVSNLLDNALRFAKRCEATLLRTERGVVLRVDDDGPGIPADQRGLVFEPFYRLEASRNRETGGTGLGLAIAKQIVDAHAGSISIGDAPLGGARVEIVFSNIADAGDVTICKA